MGFYIHVQETPNPAAVKFISQYTVKSEGRSNYKTVDECEHNALAVKVFGVEGVDSLFFFDNYITVSKTAEGDWGPLGETLLDVLQEELPKHDANYTDPAEIEEEREPLAPELQAIDDIIDRTIRPYLANDGGDVRIESRDGDTIYIKYEGACGSCPSSIGGTLVAIQSVLRDELGEPDIEVVDIGSGGADAAWPMW
ncbi:MAG: Fe-S cluster biogenesis protein NfuA [Bradymonadia bacterium]|jgi:Fe-S cluster biogenesis protein NfuA